MASVRLLYRELVALVRDGENRAISCTALFCIEMDSRKIRLEALQSKIFTSSCLISLPKSVILLALLKF